MFINTFSPVHKYILPHIPCVSEVWLIRSANQPSPVLCKAPASSVNEICINRRGIIAKTTGWLLVGVSVMTVSLCSSSRCCGWNLEYGKGLALLSLAELPYQRLFRWTQRHLSFQTDCHKNISL